MSEPLVKVEHNATAAIAGGLPTLDQLYLIIQNMMDSGVPLSSRVYVQAQDSQSEGYSVRFKATW